MENFPNIYFQESCHLGEHKTEKRLLDMISKILGTKIELIHMLISVNVTNCF